MYAVAILIIIYAFGHLLDLVQQRFGFTIALITFVTGGLSFIAFVSALIGAL